MITYFTNTSFFRVISKIGRDNIWNICNNIQNTPIDSIFYNACSFLEMEQWGPSVLVQKRRILASSAGSFGSKLKLGEYLRF